MVAFAECSGRQISASVLTRNDAPVAVKILRDATRSRGLLRLYAHTGAPVIALSYEATASLVVSD